MSEPNDHSDILPTPPSRLPGEGEGSGRVLNSVQREAPGGELSLQVQRIGEKLQFILKQREILLKENGKLKEEIRQLKEQDSGHVIRLEQLQKQVEILRASGGEMNGMEKKALEKRLSQYIREIDRCIALLGE
ncbi:hypothetical protein ACX0G9_30155 [Flavitalea flava]